MSILFPFAVAVAWIGHASIWTAVLNNLYGRALPKKPLKVWRLLTGVAVLAFPLVVWFATSRPIATFGPPEDASSRAWDEGAVLHTGAYLYVMVCGYFALVFVYITVRRARREPPQCLVKEDTRTLDLWPEYGEQLVGNGKHRGAVRVPGNCAFKFDLTSLTLALPNLPPAWDGLTILLVSDLHFHGTPSRVYFDRIFDELTAGPVPDVVCLAGDFVDSDAHREWIRPLLGRLNATEAKLAILGNHDDYHEPERVREELAAAGYTVLGNGWREVTVRGVTCVVVGHEGPWFTPEPDLTSAPTGTFRLCLSHTPDNFYWGIAHHINLMLCGHVHGGGIRVPLIGSIFVPSVYGRRFDYGVFEEGGTAMVVNRGVSGKEPLRICCNPQAVRITLVPAGSV
ncbi:metallophosphoesterase : Putative phosphohydrolase OS=Singulisphaera acidiphila (strain ATCC BAA-1392 / DSM 18658 / VKM B-2454 / MOB10) GN=Sinac_2611 PE=4 SV=1: Metallophos [Gemmata massiliana]|uniref:Calcineurin-like phosphoesterase domain-containing protein n=1 Tax=Gemmata massiliana TaxID=1210884 RepID=A0A6P2CSI8_9BACT|nr:metallophosphoesterase [Gemmata massiliana]VTR91065.1 metallophosphoesterase : Putative phosphohydrolase OS=Singulisphaera acidiphila (strain ATCC BAA-1392 / DSM 18658 / VKM B-2454 / MOB10) GN=Sinac_2611 PE=4 SV=1: Metallophos [Gemmata massiliana]